MGIIILKIGKDKHVFPVSLLLKNGTSSHTSLPVECGGKQPAPPAGYLWPPAEPEPRDPSVSPSVSNLLASLRHTGRRVTSGHTVNTS